MFPCLDAALAEANFSNGLLAVLSMNLDDFRSKNQRFGREAGTDAIRVIAHRLDHVAGPRRQVVRVGGDAFTIIDPLARQRSDVVLLAHEVLHGVRCPLTADELMTHVAVIAGESITCSVGISLGVPGSTGEELFQQADHAMGLAKSRDRGVRAGNRYVIFEDRSPGGTVGARPASTPWDVLWARR